MATVIAPPGVAASLPVKEYLTTSELKAGGKAGIENWLENERNLGKQPPKGGHSGANVAGSPIREKPKQEMSTGAEVAIGVAATGAALAAGWALLAGGGES